MMSALDNPPKVLPALLSVFSKTANFVWIQDVITVGPELHAHLQRYCKIEKLGVNKHLCATVAFGQSL